MAEDGNRDYQVGYGKPPESTKFEPGKSGNPGGRPKGAKSLRTLAQEEAYREVINPADGKPVVVDLRQRAVRALWGKALQGDLKAFTKIQELLGEDKPPPEEKKEEHIFVYMMLEEDAEEPKWDPQKGVTYPSRRRE